MMFRHIPNVLSVIRLGLVPVFIWIFFEESPNRLYLALAVFIFSGFTDVLDGYLARKNNWITPLGSVLDPLADKVMLITVLSCLVYDGLVPIVVLVIMLVKELIMIGTGFYMYLCKSKTVVPSNKYGKLATVIFYLAILLLMLKVDHTVSTIILILAVGLKILAFTTYSKYYFNTVRKSYKD